MSASTCIKVCGAKRGTNYTRDMRGTQGQQMAHYKICENCEGHGCFACNDSGAVQVLAPEQTMWIGKQIITHFDVNIHECGNAYCLVKNNKALYIQNDEVVFERNIVGGKVHEKVTVFSSVFECVEQINIWNTIWVNL